MATKTRTESTTGAGTNTTEGGAESRGLPADSSLWEIRHSMTVLAAIERWWKRVPIARRALVRAGVAEMLGQRDVEEVAAATVPR